MGVDYYAKAVIGCKVDRSKLFETKRQKSTCHDIPEGAAYCPTCGNKAYTQYEALKVFVISPCGDGDLWEAKIGELGVFQGTDDNVIAIGFGTSTGSSNGGDDSSRVPLPSDAKQRVMNALAPLGLWNEAQFGLWVILYCSY